MLCGICGFEILKNTESLGTDYCHCTDEAEAYMACASQEYVIQLASIKIGTTKFEKADAPMGVVFGLVKFHAIENPYKFLHDYCKNNQVMLNGDEPEHGLILTQSIPDLRVFNEQGVEVQGLGVAMSGSREEGYYIEIIGIAYPFFSEEFPHHVKAYEGMFK